MKNIFKRLPGAAQATTQTYVPKKKRITKNRVIIGLTVSNLILIAVAYWSVSKIYNFHCAEGGYFITDEKCGEMADSNFYRAEYYRLSEAESRTATIAEIK